VVNTPVAAYGIGPDPIHLDRIKELERENAELRDRIEQYVWETT
jgi:hypothetical protein